MRLGGPHSGDHGVAGLFQPNTPGRGELRSSAGFRERQMLKSRAQYVGERIRVGVAADEVSMWRLGPCGVRLDVVGRWPLSDVVGIPIAPRGVDDPSWPALVLLDLRRLEFVADLRAFRSGPAEREVVRQLAAGPGLSVAGSR